MKSLRPNPYQPRTVFDPDKLRELVESVKHSGVIQPLIVRKKGRQYEIVAGGTALEGGQRSRPQQGAGGDPGL